MVENSTDQLRLVLWKNCLLRLRQPVILCLEVVWPVIIFILLLLLRYSIPPEQQATCYYNARALPSAGPVPLLQGLICNIDNQCLNRTSYQDIPTYPNSKLDRLVSVVSPLFHNINLLRLANELPTTSRLLDTISDLLKHDSVNKLFISGIPISELVVNRSEVTRILQSSTSLSSDHISSLLSSKLSVPSLVYAFITKNVNCNQDIINSVVLSTDSSLVKALAEEMCNPIVGGKRVSDLVPKILRQLNVENVIKTISEIADALDQTAISANIKQLESLVHFLSRNLPIAQSSSSSSSSPLASQLLHHTSRLLELLTDTKHVNVEFLEGIWNHWGPKVAPDLWRDTGDLVKVAIKALTAQEGVKVHYDDSELRLAMSSLSRVLSYSSTDTPFSNLSSALSGSIADLTAIISPNSTDPTSDAKLLALFTRLLQSEATAISESGTYPYLPRVVESVALTLTDPTKLQSLLDRKPGSPLNITRDICDPNVFGQLFVHSGESGVLSRYACDLLTNLVPSSINFLFGGVSNTKNLVNPEKMKALELVSAVVEVARAVVKGTVYDFKEKLDSAINAFQFQIWQDKDAKAKMNIGTSALQLAQDFTAQLKPSSLNLVTGSLNAASSILQVIDSQVSDVLLRREISMESLFLGVSSLQRSVNIFTKNLPLLIAAADSALTRGLNTSSLSTPYKWCNRNTRLSSYLLLNDKKSMDRFERQLCDEYEKILPEMMSTSPTAEIFAAIGKASYSRKTFFNWVEFGQRMMKLRETFASDLVEVEWKISGGFKMVADALSEVRIMLDAGINPIEHLRSKMRPLQLFLQTFVGTRLGRKSLPLMFGVSRELGGITGLLNKDEVMVLNAFEYIVESPTVSYLVWAEKHLPNLVSAASLTLIKDPRKLLNIISSGNFEDAFCSKPFGEIFFVDDETRDGASQKAAEGLSELCEIATSSLVDDDEINGDTLVPTLMKQVSSLLDLQNRSPDRIRSPLLNAEAWQGALKAQMVATNTTSVPDHLFSVFGRVLDSLDKDENAGVTETIKRYSCVQDRAKNLFRETDNVEDSSLKDSAWYLMKNSEDVVRSAYDSLMMPQSVKKIMKETTDEWADVGRFCGSDANVIRSVSEAAAGQHQKTVSNALRGVKNIMCSSTEKTAQEFQECSATEEPVATTVQNLLTEASNLLLPPAHPRKVRSLPFLTTNSWTSVATQLLNRLRNAITDQDLVDPSSWVDLLLKATKTQPDLQLKIKELVSSLGVWAEEKLASFKGQTLEEIVGDNQVVSFLRDWSSVSNQSIRTIMWYLTSAVDSNEENFAFNFDFNNLTDVQKRLCSENVTHGSEFTRLFCTHDLETIYKSVRQILPKASLVNKDFSKETHETLKKIERLMDSKTKELKDTFTQEATRYQNRIEHGITRLLLSTMWIYRSPGPSIWPRIVDATTDINWVLEVLPSGTVANFLLGEVTPQNIEKLLREDTKPFTKFLIQNLLPLTKDSSRSESVLLYIWNTVEHLIKAFEKEQCPTATKQDSQLEEVLTSIGSFPRLVCQLPKTGIDSAYKYLMEDIGLTNLTLDFNGLCASRSVSRLMTFAKMTTSDKNLVRKCAAEVRDSPLASDVATYGELINHAIQLSIAMTGKPKSNESAIDTVAGWLPVYSRLENIMVDKLLPKELSTIDKDLGATIVNIKWLLDHRDTPEDLKKIFCGDKINPVFQFPHHVYPKGLCDEVVPSRIIRSTDFQRLIPHIKSTQNHSVFSGAWLSGILQPKVIRAVASVGREMSPILKLLEEPVTLDTVTAMLVTLNYGKLYDLHESFAIVKEPVDTIFPGSFVATAVDSISEGLVGIRDLAEKGLFSVKFKISEVLNDPEDAKKQIMKALNTNGYFVDFILALEFDTSSFLTDKATRSFTFKQVASHLDLLKRAFNLPKSSSLFDSYSKVLRQAVDTLGIPEEPLVTIAQQRLMKNVVDVLLEKALKKRDLNWDHLVNIFNALSKAPAIFRDLESSFNVIQNLLGQTTIKGLAGLNVTKEGVRVLASPVALKLIGKVVCGRALRDLEQEFKLLQPSSREPSLNEKDIEELPEEFCRTGYEQVMRLTGGPIIWGFLKPVLRGKLLYAPDTPESRMIVTELNRTIELVGVFREILYKWGDATNGLKLLLGNTDTISEVKDALLSKALKPIVKEIFPSGINLESFDLSKITDEIGDIGGLMDMLQLVANISHCFNLDRFQAVATEMELETLAPAMSKRKEFIAAFVFDNFKKGKVRRKKRAMGLWEMMGFAEPEELEAVIPSDVRYKIRMDIDYVPLTHRTKDLFWRPGPRSDFFEQMRYHRGFSQMQQMIDKSILQAFNRQVFNGTSKQLELPDTFAQQFPYPCYENDSGGHFLKSILPAACLVSWLFVVAFFIRQRVLEREQHLQEVLSVMGLKNWIDVTAWVLLSALILTGIVTVNTLIVSLGGILPRSNIFLLFAFYLSFAMSLLSYCYLLSNLLQRNATLAALSGTVLYIVAFVPFIIALTSEASLIFWQKLLLCVSMCSAFCYGHLYITRFEEQALGLTWQTAFESPLSGDNMNFMWALYMLLFDTLLYAILGWYFGIVFSSNPVLKQKWYFFLQKDYWFGKRRGRNNSVSRDDGKDGVSISDLTVQFSPTNIAVNKLSLHLNDGEITTLLGQNGAGKTTTIKVLTGQCLPTSGQVDAYGINTANLSELRRLIGYCPQYNTLFDRLTVTEHLQFFALLKSQGKSREEIEEDVSAMLKMMDLEHVADRMAYQLSGGLQRRLCVGLSFIGGSKLIILDEPTSSVDPVARRQIWDLVLKYRQRRTILLTTHHMDEADLLSDKVAIIHRGNLLCHGSPITLKTKFGCGYQLSLTRHSARDSDSGHESASHSDHNSIRSLDGTYSKSILEDIKLIVPSAEVVSDTGSQMNISLPQRDKEGNSYDFATLFDKLDTSELLIYHGFTGFSVTSTTLEDAFLNLSALVERNPCGEAPLDGLTYKEVYSPTDSSSQSWQEDAESTNSLYLASSNKITGMSLQVQQLKALLCKHWLHSSNNWRVLFSSVIMPCIFIALAMGITTLKPDIIKEPALELNMAVYGPRTISVLSTPPRDSLGRQFLGDEYVNITNKYKIPSAEGCPEVDRARASLDKTSVRDVSAFGGKQEIFVMDPSVADINDYLLATYADFAEKRYGGWSVTGKDKDKVKIWFDNNAHHSMPIYQNGVTNAVLRRALGSNYTVSVINHPLHLSHEQLGRETFISRMADLGVALVILIGLGFIPASAVIYVVRERVLEEKIVQHCSGVSRYTYWLANLLWDYIILLIAVVLCGSVVWIFGIQVYVARSNYFALVLLLFLFGWASIPLMHLVSHLFHESSIAFMVVYCVNLFIGLKIFIVLLLLTSYIHAHQGTVLAYVLHGIALCVPQYAFISGILSMFKNHIRADIYELFGQDVYESPYELLMGNYIALGLVGVACFILNLLVDSQFFSCGFSLSKKTWLEPPRETEDSDVLMERKRVVSAIGDDVLSLINMVKVYNTFGRSKIHRAVDNVSFGIGKGVCFGLLGLNGAGKTTLFKILTGHIQPTHGRAFLKEKSGIYRSLSKLNHHVGYCPQSDAVDDLLTPRQHLSIYAQLKGIQRSQVNSVVEKALSLFQLGAFADRACVALSRGTRRKVCTALAFLGDPQLVLLDEPTTGMDPVTRRLLWTGVQKCVDSGRSILLTSHSMEECDALCQRLGIMVNGRLCCIGSPEYLKHRFGSGYTVGLRIEQDSEDRVLNFILERYPSARVKSRHATSLQLSISPKEGSLASLFSLLQGEPSRECGILDFALSQTTLDQVFVDFAGSQKDEDEDVDLEFEEAFSRVPTISSFSGSYQQLSSRGYDNLSSENIDSTKF